MMSHCIRFANGQGWRLIGTEEVAPWVAMMASILGIEAGEGDALPSLVFVEKQTTTEGPPLHALDKVLRDIIPDRGWKALECFGINLWIGDGSGDMIAEIDSHAADDYQVIANMSISLRHLFWRCQKSGALPMHAALITCEGAGMLLAGRGEAGKSTSCRRLPLPWIALCDEEAFIVRSATGSYHAHPIPTWKYAIGEGQKRWNVEASVPLKAIFFIDKTSSASATLLGQGEAALSIYHSSLQASTMFPAGEARRKALSGLFENASALALAVPSYILPIRGCFWEEIERVLALKR
jgi:SynChlorMet cassette protein ScmC